jgi:hypothetical protein
MKMGTTRSPWRYDAPARHALQSATLNFSASTSSASSASAIRLAIKAGQGRLTLKDYLAYPHVVVTFNDPRLSPIDQTLQARGRIRRVGLVSPQFSANIAALTGTDPIMSLPSRLASAASANGAGRLQAAVGGPRLSVFAGMASAD